MHNGSSPCICNAGRLRSSNQTTIQVDSYISLRPEVTVSVSALLKLSQWCHRRLDAHSGEIVCSSPTPLPPACAPAPSPNRDVSGDNAAPAMGNAACGESTVSEPDCGSGDCPAQPFVQKGGA